MTALSRHRFLARGSAAAAGLAGATGVAEAAARTPPGSGDDLTARAAGQHAMLFDGTLCVGCRGCELACNTDNDLGRTPDEIFEGRLAEDARALGTNVFTYVTFHPWEQDPSTAHFGKVQCMHCIEPACVSSCPVHALEKLDDGPVVWHGEICLGCRYWTPGRITRVIWFVSPIVWNLRRAPVLDFPSATRAPRRHGR